MHKNINNKSYRVIILIIYLPNHEKKELGLSKQSQKKDFKI